MVGGVPYVPGHVVRRVTNEDHSYGSPRAYISHPGISSRTVKIGRMNWTLHGLAAVIAVGALALIADGGTLLLIAWIIR